MPHCRVNRRPDESEADWLARPFVDCDAAELPDRATRARWRLRDGRVEVVNA
jgi:hypothetical protein